MVNPSSGLGFIIGKSAKVAGPIAKPKSPEEFYHNARLFELEGNYILARKAYQEFFRSA